jgi:hypothetical protein
MSTDHNFITGFIECRSFPCLWKKTDPPYHNTVKRENAYKILLEKHNEYDPNETKRSVLGKNNSSRSACSKEYKQIKESERSGAGTDHSCSPPLRYCVFSISFMQFARDSDCLFGAGLHSLWLLLPPLLHC